MNFWETITGSDITREWTAFEARAEALPAGHRAAWEQIKAHLSAYGDFTGRNLMPLFDNALGLLEETASDGLSIDEVLGDDIGASARRWPVRKGAGVIATGGVSS
ncbi:DUF1048 domain-containing protein [Nonomuraea sp. NPDC048892]|uniref:DUF1048 domain-containing protein n=1 Tax=Nonomuraea sp. NPDC048892 TaxID=3154624 RepID=UPI0033EBB4ED